MDTEWMPDWDKGLKLKLASAISADQTGTRKNRAAHLIWSNRIKKRKEGRGRAAENGWREPAGSLEVWRIAELTIG